MTLPAPADLPDLRLGGTLLRFRLPADEDEARTRAAQLAQSLVRVGWGQAGRALLVDVLERIASREEQAEALAAAARARRHQATLARWPRVYARRRRRPG